MTVSGSTSLTPESSDHPGQGTKGAVKDQGGGALGEVETTKRPIESSPGADREERGNDARTR